jgi:tricorn protease
MGYLGADLEPVAGATPAYRVTRIYPGDGFDLQARSPLLLPGVDVKPGDYILSVAGRPVRTDQDIQALLVGTADQPITLTVNASASAEGAREVLIRPMASEYMARYYDWTAGRAAYVREHGGANLAYLHLPNMSGDGLREFAKHYYANLDKDGFVYDIRFNGGGYIDAMVLLQMSSKPYTYFKPRYGASWTRQDWSFAGHSVALINDQSYSDAEEFCDAFRRLKVGPVIGVRSWGGEVGSGGGYPLADGGAIFIPNYAEWAPDGTWLIEGTGVVPDMTVEDDPTALMAGKDPQLDAAIAYLKERLTAEPVIRPVPPSFPVKANRGSDTGGRP